MGFQRPAQVTTN